MSSRFKGVRQFFSALLVMLGLAWQAHPLALSGLVILTTLQGLVPLATAWLTKILFDRLALALQGEAALSWVLPILVAQALVFVVSQMLNPASGYLNNELQRKLTLTMEMTLYEKIGRFVGIAYFENPEFHDTLQMASMGLQVGPAQSLQALLNLGQSIVILLSFLVTLLIINPLLAALVSLAALPQLVLQWRFGRQRYGLAFTLSPDQRRAFYYGQLLSGLEATKEIRLFGLANYFISRLQQIYQKIHRAERSQEWYELRWKIFLEFLSALVFSLALVIAVAQALARRLSLGDVTLYNNAVRSLQGAFSGLIFGLSTLNEYVLSFQNYQRLMALPQPVKVTVSPRPVPPLAFGIELRDISFRYTEKHPWVLRHLNLFIPAGKCLALVGANGAGKTTLVKLLTRLYDPQEGTILWNGIDIREFDPESLRNNTGVIFQDFMSYAFTAQENIGLGRVEFVNNLARIQQAAAKVGVHETIQNLPYGYQTMLIRLFGDDGSSADLSGGEWQKIALARLFMRQADALILDEPTASLDAESEHEIYAHFAELVAGRTCLLISHRFATVRMADMIAVLENGQISEWGTHEVLLSRRGTYARLYQMQAERYA